MILVRFSAMERMWAWGDWPCCLVLISSFNKWQHCCNPSLISDINQEQNKRKREDETKVIGEKQGRKEKEMNKRKKKKMEIMNKRRKREKETKRYV